MKSPAQRAIMELSRVLDHDLSWRSSYPDLVDIRPQCKENCGIMGSFSHVLHQAVWNALQNLARTTPDKTQESRGDWKRYHDRSPPRKVSSRGETTNAEQQLNENVSLLDLQDRSCSDRASVIDPT